MLSYSSQKLLDKLVNDLKGRLPPSERVLDKKKDGPSILYNLFQPKGNFKEGQVGEMHYQFSFKQFAEIYEYLTNE